MSITMIQPGQPVKPEKLNPAAGPQKPDPQEQAKQRKREHLQKQQQQIQKQIETLGPDKTKKTFASFIRDLSIIIGAIAPNQNSAKLSFWSNIAIIRPIRFKKYGSTKECSIGRTTTDKRNRIN